MASISQYLSVGVQTLAFSALEKFDTLNSFTNWITGGKVNRDTLATSIFHKAVELGADYAVESKSLGERSAILVPLAKDALINNDMERMRASVAALASDTLGQYIDLNPEGEGVISTWVRSTVDGAVRGSSAKIAESFVGDHAAEKILATMVKQHGAQTLNAYLDNMLHAMPLSKFVSTQVKNILQRAILDKPEFDMSDNAEYRLLAGLADTVLSGEQDYDKHLKDYAPKTMAVIEASQKTTQVMTSGIAYVCDTASSIQQSVSQGVQSVVGTTQNIVQGISTGVQSTVSSASQGISQAAQYSYDVAAYLFSPWSWGASEQA